MTRLKRRYLRLNWLYFGNRLPLDTQVKWHRMRGDDSDSAAFVEFDDPPTICVSKELRAWPRIAEFSLLHEMVHLDSGAEHGARWQRGMRRLARVGAFAKLW